jgi:hypothetical protein
MGHPCPLVDCWVNAASLCAYVCVYACMYVCVCMCIRVCGRERHVRSALACIYPVCVRCVLLSFYVRERAVRLPVSASVCVSVHVC